MSRLQIRGSESADGDLEYKVCSHLRPIEILFERESEAPNPQKLSVQDGVSVRVLPTPIDFALIESSFLMPVFIVLDRKRGTVSCGKCRCEIRQAPGR